jgi:hypothetical protein
LKPSIRVCNVGFRNLHHHLRFRKYIFHHLRKASSFNMWTFLTPEHVVWHAQLLLLFSIQLLPVETKFIFLLNSSSGDVIVFSYYFWLFSLSFLYICRCCTAQAWIGALMELLSSLLWCCTAQAWIGALMEQSVYGKLKNQLGTIFNFRVSWCLLVL